MTQDETHPAPDETTVPPDAPEPQLDADQQPGAEELDSPAPAESPAADDAESAAEMTGQEPSTEPVPDESDEETPDAPQKEYAPLPDNARPAIEALLFAAGESLTVRRIADALGNDLDPKAVRGVLGELKDEYEQQGRGFGVEEIAGGFQLLSRAEYAPQVGNLIRSRDNSKFSQAALETLAIIAYKQPIGRAEIENIRGVQAGPLLRTLMDRRLIKIVGREDVPGRPFLYGTTREFLERMGLKSLSDLPKLEDIQRETKE